jgi:hypothetical protein
LTKSESSRINGAKSQGPSTPEGLAASSLNAVTHGISAKTLILQNESPTEFLALLNSYLDRLQPANQIEIDLVSDLVASRWRLRRMWRYETAMLDIEMDVQAAGFAKRFTKHDEDMRGSSAFASLADAGKGFSTALRYEVHLSRVYRRTLSEYQNLTKGRTPQHA